jgi:N-acetylmuramoyl-L-alanine amidase
VVDDREAIQLLEHEEMAWHAGDGCDDPARDTGCFASIAIETCVNEDGDWARTRRNLVALVRHILRTDARFSAERIAPHHRWSGKDCPQRLRAEGSWERLLDEIRQEKGMGG